MNAHRKAYRLSTPPLCLCAEQVRKMGGVMVSYTARCSFIHSLFIFCSDLYFCFLSFFSRSFFRLVFLFLTNSQVHEIFQTRGECLSNSDKIRTVHNSFARPTLYELDIKGGKSEDNFHFVTYIPVGDKVYELDGLREAPIEVADIPAGSDWMDAVTPAIQKRIQKYSEGEIHFNLMAVIPNRKQKLEEMLKSVQEANVDGSLDDQITEMQIEIANEDEKHQQYRKENARRRHNYLPFVIELLKILAKEGKLIPLFEQAITQAEQRAIRNKY